MLLMNVCFWKFSFNIFALQLTSGGLDSKESTCKFGRPGFDPWVGKIPCRRAWQPTPVFLPRESPWTDEPGGLQSTGSQSLRTKNNTSEIEKSKTVDKEGLLYYSLDVVYIIYIMYMYNIY